MSNDITGGLRNLKGGSIDALRGPYPTIAAANLAIPDTIVDDLNFREGKFVDIGIKPNLVTHWWKGGYKNENLVEYIEVTQAKFNSVAPVASMLILSDNLLNNADLVFGGWSKTGGKRISSTELRTPLIDIDPGKLFLTLSGGFNIGANMARYVFFNKAEVFVSYADDLTSAIPGNGFKVGVSVAVSSIMGNDPTSTQFAISAMLNYGTEPKPWQGFRASLDSERIKGLDLKTVVRIPALYNASGKNKFDAASVINGKIIRSATGLVEDRGGKENGGDSSISAPIPVKPGDIGILSGLTNTTRTIRFIDTNGNPLKPKRLDGTDYATYSYPGGAFMAPPGSVYFQFLWRYNFIGNSDLIQFEENNVSTAYESFIRKIGADQIAGNISVDLDGYTKSGGSDKTAKDLDAAIQQSYSQINAVQSSANNALSKSDEAKLLADTVSQLVLTRIFGSSQIQDAAINLNKISQSLIDYINASGGGSIINQPDDEDLTKISDVLKLKDGADGYARVRLKTSVSLQLAEVRSKAENYRSILIKDVIDLAAANGTRSTLILPDGTKIKFVGSGMLKNTYLYGKNLIIEASRNQIFDNVQFFVYGAGGVQIPSTPNNVLNVTIPAAATVDFFDKKNKIVYLASSGSSVNPIDTKPMHAKLSNLPVLVKDGNVWKLNVGSRPQTLALSGANVLIPTSNKYIYFDKETDAILPGGSVYDPAKVKGTFLSDYTQTSRSTIYNELYPEWWGAKCDGTTDNTDALNICIRMASASSGGVVSLAGNGSRYMSRGGIVLLSNVFIDANNSVIRLMNNASNHLIIHDDIKTLLRCDWDKLRLDGNRNNQMQNWYTVYVGWPLGQPFYSQEGSYSWSESSLTDVYVEFSKGHGIYVAVPGDITVLTPRLRYNDIDGIFWEKEHFKIIEPMTWYNGRDGMHTNGGNHFSIVGGKNAHNGRHNINLENAFEFQLSMVATIDAPNGVNLNISNCYGFIINNVRCVGPSGIGIKVDQASRNGKILGVIDKDNTISVMNESSSVEIKDVVTY